MERDDHSGIDGREWCDETWNPIRGVAGKWHCTKVSAGCTSCYAERINIRWGGPAYKPGLDTFRLDEKILAQPLHWKKPRKIFVCDMTDLFHEDISIGYVANVFNVMASARLGCRRIHQHEGECWSGEDHIYQILTKRAFRIAPVLDEMQIYAAERMPVECPLNVCLDAGYWPLCNVWLGVSFEDQATADECIPLLLQTPAAVRFVSYEPALGPVDLSVYLCPDGASGFDHGLQWVIIGGESGPKARPFDIAWARSAISQCRGAKVPVFYKQGGAAHRCPHSAKGGCQDCMPVDLRIREFPMVGGGVVGTRRENLESQCH